MVVRRTESDRTANGIRLGGERNLIGRRTVSDWAANVNGRKPMIYNIKSHRFRTSKSMALFFFILLVVFLLPSRSLLVAEVSGLRSKRYDSYGIMRR